MLFLNSESLFQDSGPFGLYDEKQPISLIKSEFINFSNVETKIISTLR